MKIPGLRFQVPGHLAICGFFLLSLYVSSCSDEKASFYKRYCTDRHTYVNKNASGGVDDDPIVLCPGKKMRWDDHGEDWEVDFTNDSPFEGKPMKMDKNNRTGKARSDLKKDTSFPYTVTFKDRKADPQIIVMGGGS
jgi:hypothetical protein